MKYTTRKERRMTEQNEARQMSIWMTPDVWKEVQDLKKVYFDKTYGEVLRMMLMAGADALKSEAGKEPATA